MKTSPVETKNTHRQRQKDQTRRLILSSARSLFEKEGYDQTTIRKIASHAGIGLGTIYKHFSKKSTVLVSSFCHDIGNVLEEAIQEIPEKMGFKQSLMFLFGKLCGFYAENHKLARIYMRQVPFMTGEDKALTDVVDERFLTFVGSLVEKAKKNKEIQEEVDTGLVGFSFFSHYLVVLGYYFFKAPAFSKDQALELLEQLTDLSIKGLN